MDSAERIDRDIETLAGPDYTVSDEAIRRYAYTPEYRATLDYFTEALRGLGFDVSEDPVGTLVARNRPPGEKVFGIGSHCDSNRNGGKYDGTMGVVTALEVCRLNAELGLDLPLQLVSFLEEEGSGFGQMLLGSRIMLQRVTEDELRDSFRAIDDGRAFWEHAAEAGYEPERWRESIHVLDDLTGWIEMHIEQARVLQDTGNRVGIVTAIAGYVHADVVVTGRGDHAGATPMDLRLDPTLPLAETRTLASVVDAARSGMRFSMVGFAVAAVIGLFMGAIGLYGVLSYVTAQRTREIGVRMALGATPSSVRASIVRRGLLVSAIGLAVGLGAAVSLRMLAKPLLYGITPTDPFTLAAVSLVLLCAGALAAWLPARRAARLDPVRALRWD